MKKSFVEHFSEEVKLKGNPSLIWNNITLGTVNITKIITRKKASLSNGIEILGIFDLLFLWQKYVYALPCHFVIGK